MQSIDSALRSLAANILCNAPEGEAPTIAWPMICGSAVAAKTSAQQFENGTLTIRVPDTKWKSELQGFALQYLSAFDKILPGQVKQLRFTDSPLSEISKP